MKFYKRNPDAALAGMAELTLQERGAYKRDYAPGTLREKLHGPGRARLGPDHPANVSGVPA